MSGMMDLVKKNLGLDEEGIVLSQRLQAAELGYRVGCVGDDFSEKNILLGIEPFFNNGEDMLGLNRDPAFFDIVFHGLFVDPFS